MLIRAQDLNVLITLIGESIKVQAEVWAYGSRVKGTAHDGSDIDLVIRHGNLLPIPAEQIDALREKIRESTIPVLVQLNDWADLPERLHAEIVKQYEVLFSSLHPAVI